jgi:membrane-associated PAP2 superfamily phosphatase
MWLVGGIACGSTVGLGRMLQGAHFARDVLWAFGFVYLTGLSRAYAFCFQESSQCEKWAASQSLLGKGAAAVETMQCEY